MAMKRLKDQSGFTLAETLLAVMILLLVSTIVATGVPAAQNAYEKVIVGANAQTMLSTAITALRDELGTAWQVRISEDGQEITYFNADTGAQSRLSKYPDAEAGGTYPAIKLQNYVPLAAADLIHDYDDTAPTEGDARHLVPDKNTGLFVTFGSFGISDTDPSVVVVDGLAVCKQKEPTKPLAQLGEGVRLEIRVLSEDAAKTED